MSPAERGFTVPAWLHLAVWAEVWATPDGSRFVLERTPTEHDFPAARHLGRRGMRPRDPNRADRGDRPDLLGAS